ncbi:hypothetical protein BDZ91DRAFT_726704 [Kalaharituber pfeilii]|nr:hypothetical protein BDZ91DRAFT_726704 [Kalaharituber pfeilii]
MSSVSTRTGQVPAGSIASSYRECISYFNELCSTSDSLEDELARDGLSTSFADELARFRIWAANSGAHHPAKSKYSMEYRLREASNATTMVLRALGKLKQLLRSAADRRSHDHDSTEVGGHPLGKSELLPPSSPISSSGSYDPPDLEPISEEARLQDICSNINAIITLLYRLLIAIRRPVVRDDSPKYSTIDVSHWEFYDRKHVQDKFPKTHEFLFTRLGKANTQRRQFFQYQKDHREKLARERGEVHINDEPAPPEGTVVTKVSTLVDLPGPALAAENPLGMMVEVGSDGGQTQTSYACMSAMGDGGGGRNLKAPPPPNSVRAYAGEPFECPYCLYPVAVQDFRSWHRHHVFKDLRPYLCTFRDCTTPDQLFETRRKWFEHELQFHRKEWFCNDCEIVFTSEKDLEKHLQQLHSGICTAVLLPIIIKGCQRAPKSTQRCALCMEEKPASKIRNHVARHLQQLALFSLPQRKDLEVSEEGENQDTDENESGISGLDNADVDPGRQQAPSLTILSDTTSTAFLREDIDESEEGENQDTGENDSGVTGLEKPEVDPGRQQFPPIVNNTISAFYNEEQYVTRAQSPQRGTQRYSHPSTDNRASTGPLSLEAYYPRPHQGQFSNAYGTGPPSPRQHLHSSLPQFTGMPTQLGMIPGGYRPLPMQDRMRRELGDPSRPLPSSALLHNSDPIRLEDPNPLLFGLPGGHTDGSPSPDYHLLRGPSPDDEQEREWEREREREWKAEMVVLNEGKQRKWTKISKEILSQQAVEQMGYQFELHEDSITIHKELMRDEIDHLVELSMGIRGHGRRDRDSERDGDNGSAGPIEGKQWKWTRISREILSQRAVEQMGYQFEPHEDSITIYKVLMRDEIDHLVELSMSIRGHGRTDRDSERDGDNGSAGPIEGKQRTWTRISREILSQRAVEQMGYQFEPHEDSITIYKELMRDEIDHLVELSMSIRGHGRRDRDSERDGDNGSAGPIEGKQRKWTRISRKILSQRAVEQMGYQFEPHEDSITIHKELMRDEIDHLVELSMRISNLGT